MCKQVLVSAKAHRESKSRSSVTSNSKKSITEIRNENAAPPTATSKKVVREVLGDKKKPRSSTPTKTAEDKHPKQQILNENARSPSAISKKPVSEVLGERKNKPRSSTPKKSPEDCAAFSGASFDKQGFCINHPHQQLANPILGGDGTIVYQELKVSCPSCQSAKHKIKRGTSLSGGKVQEKPHRSIMSGKSTRSRSRSIERRKEKPVFRTPFDEKGRCHYHKNVQLAGKKMTGGWKVIHPICPKCMEDKLEEDDDRSVKSGKSTKSSKSSRSGLSMSSGGNAQGQYDKNGCCVLHAHIQVAKKKVFGHGWKVLRVCPACSGGDNISMDDASSVSSRSVSSRKSSRSVVSANSRGKKVSSGRYGVLPFDGEGYCCRHPSVQMAQKKLMGGFKIIFDVCPECAVDGGIEPKKRSARRKSGTGRIFDDSGSECSSVISGISGSSSISKKKRRVKNMKLRDEDGKAGKYSGYVNEDYKPHGDGVIKYDDGSVWSGVWNEGSQVHGQNKKRSKSKEKN